MAKQFISRLGLAQISINPAYADELVSAIQEPTFPQENQRVGLFSIAGLEEVGRLQQNLAEKYVTHLNIRWSQSFDSRHQITSSF